LLGKPTEVGLQSFTLVQANSLKDNPALSGAPHLWYYHFFGWDDGILVRFDYNNQVVHVDWGMGEGNCS